MDKLIEMKEIAEVMAMLSARLARLLAEPGAEAEAEDRPKSGGLVAEVIREWMEKHE